jgi:hypothetical protein
MKDIKVEVMSDRIGAVTRVGCSKDHAIFLVSFNSPIPDEWNRESTVTEQVYEFHNEVCGEKHLKFSNIPRKTQSLIGWTEDVIHIVFYALTIDNIKTM